MERVRDELGQFLEVEKLSLDRRTIPEQHHSSFIPSMSCTIAQVKQRRDQQKVVNYLQLGA